MLRCRTSASNSCQGVGTFRPFTIFLFYFRLHQKLNWAAFGLHVAQDHGGRIRFIFLFCVPSHKFVGYEGDLGTRQNKTTAGWVKQEKTAVRRRTIAEIAGDILGTPSLFTIVVVGFRRTKSRLFLSAKFRHFFAQKGRNECRHFYPLLEQMNRVLCCSWRRGKDLDSRNGEATEAPTREN